MNKIVPPSAHYNSFVLGAESEQENLTDSLARFLSAECGFPVSPDELVVTAGNSEAIYAVTRHLLSDEDYVAVETPTFFLADFLLREARGPDGSQRQMAIPLDGSGMDLAYLETQIAQGRCPKLVYTIPNFHNPTGVCMSEMRKAHLVDLAEKHDFYILSDDPYHLLNYNKNVPRPSSMMAHDKGRGRVISAGSFSKILNAELRVGWIHADKQLVDGFLHQWVGEIDPTLSNSLKDMIDRGGLHRHLRHLSRTLCVRQKVMCQALNMYLPAGCSFQEVDGGYFVWVQLPRHTQSNHFLEFCSDKYSVAFLEGTRCAAVGAMDQGTPSFHNYLRLSFSHYPEDIIEMGVQRLCAALTHYLRLYPFG